MDGRQKLTRYQWGVLAIAWLGWLFDIFDSALFNFAKGPMLAEVLGPGVPTAPIEGKMQMLYLGGWALGGLVFGVLADRWGRTKTLALTILLYSVFTGLTALCVTWQQVAAVRFLTAIGLGGEWAAGAALVAEVFPQGRRALAAGLLQTAAAFGPILAGLANLAIVPSQWRLLFVLGVAPAALTVVVRLWVREPERWTLARSAQERAAPLKQLWGNPRWRRNAIVATLIGAVGIAGAGNASYWHPNLVAEFSKGLPAALVQDRKSFALFTFHIGTLLGVLLVPILCQALGRRVAMAAFFVGAPLSFVLVAQAGSYEALLWLGPIMSFFAIGVSGAFVLYFPELFPTSLRATGAGLAYNVGRVISAPVPWVTGLLMAGVAGGVAAGFAQAALIYVVGLAVLPFAAETRGQDLPEGDAVRQPTVNLRPEIPG